MAQTWTAFRSFGECSSSVPGCTDSPENENLKCFLTCIAAKIRPAIKKSRKGVTNNFFTFTASHYFSKTVDLIVTVELFFNGAYFFAVASLIPILMANVWQSLSTWNNYTTLCPQRFRLWKSFLGLVGLGPLSDAFDVWTDAPFYPAEQNAGPLLRLENTRIRHVLVSIVPETLIQTDSYISYLTGRQPFFSLFQILSLLTSLILLGNTMARSNIRTEVAWASFWANFSLYGYLDESRKWSLKGMFLGQALLNIGYFALFVLSIVFGILHSQRFHFYWPVLSVLMVEFGAFCSFKVYQREMWHPGTIVQHSLFNDYIIGFTDKIQMFLSAMSLVRFPNRDPRRLCPQLFFGCFAYRCVVNNVILGVTLAHEDISQDLLYFFISLILVCNIFVIFGFSTVLICSHPSHQKSWFWGRSMSGKELYRSIFESEKCFTKFTDKDEEKAFFCKTRHAIWIPCDLLSEWICISVASRFGENAGNERQPLPKWLDIAFAHRIVSIFEYHQVDPGWVRQTLDDCLPCPRN